ncbi:hypothetical protein Tola_1188 [Tolumonas auensis DSM 9187]|uniref:HIRAN domain-containing protein n=2 Tax=Tolumonas TaxID=43947 RepID=C4LDL3_TOLAT|nr:HIRAN domain-containing protein [Tolumonas auensis]ACQ92809.1 hypothetical protein Tola_1188 [Tolumonas auensis DSM 9187]
MFLLFKSKKYEEKITTLESKNIDLKSNLVELESENTILKSKLIELESAIAKSSNKISELTIKLSISNRSNETLKKGLDALNQSANQDIDKQKKIRNEYISAFNIVASEKEALSKKNTKLMDKLNELEQKQLDYSLFFSDKFECLEQKNNFDYSTDYINLHHKLDQQQTLIDNLTRNSVQLKKDKNSAEFELKKYTEEQNKEKERLHKKLDKINEENKTLKALIDSTKKPALSNYFNYGITSPFRIQQEKIETNKTFASLDSTEIMGLLPKELIGTPIKINGVSYQNDDGTSRQQILQHTKTSSHVSLIRDSNNPHDNNAIKVITRDGCIGFIPRDIASKLRSIKIENLTANIHSIGKAEVGLYGASIIIKNI